MAIVAIPVAPPLATSTCKYEFIHVSEWIVDLFYFNESMWICVLCELMTVQCLLCVASRSMQ